MGPATSPSGANSGFYNVSLPTQDAANLFDDLTAKGFVVREVEGSKMTTTHGAYEEFARAFEFPGYFGWNVDAMDECIRDLSWLPTKSGYIVAIHDPDLVLTAERGLSLSWFTSLMDQPIDYWSTPVTGKWSRPGYSFIVLLLELEDESDLINLWQNAGATVVPLTRAALATITGVEDIEPPPLGGIRISVGYTEQIPFGSPPPEDVTLVGDVPWELRD